MPTPAGECVSVNTEKSVRADTPDQPSGSSGAVVYFGRSAATAVAAGSCLGRGLEVGEPVMVRVRAGE
jgi:hypothetical protein